MQTDAISVSQKSYRCKVTDYGAGNGELSFWYEEPLGREERRLNQLYPLLRQPKEISDIPVDPDSETNEQRAMRRAKSKARKLAMTMKADRILTLTFRENLIDRYNCDKLFVRFIKLVHEKYPNWKYVSCAEKQKRGAWHYHLAVSGFQDVGFFRQAWLKLTDGNIDVTSPRTKGDKDKSACIIASYITKYLNKAFVQNYEFGKQRYRCSQGIVLREAIFWISSQTWRDAIKDASDFLENLYGHVGTVYLSDDWNSGWFSSWSLRK